MRGEGSFRLREILGRFHTRLLGRLTEYIAKNVPEILEKLARRQTEKETPPLSNDCYMAPDPVTCGRVYRRIFSSGFAPGSVIEFHTLWPFGIPRMNLPKEGDARWRRLKRRAQVDTIRFLELAQHFAEDETRKRVVESIGDIVGDPPRRESQRLAFPEGPPYL